MYFDLIGALFSSCAFSWEPKNARGEDLVYMQEVLDQSNLNKSINIFSLVYPIQLHTLNVESFVTEATLEVSRRAPNEGSLPNVES